MNLCVICAKREASGTAPARNGSLDSVCSGCTPSMESLTLYWDKVSIGVYRLIDSENRIYATLRPWGCTSMVDANVNMSLLPKPCQAFETLEKAAEWCEQTHPLVVEYARIRGLVSLWSVRVEAQQ